MVIDLKKLVEDNYDYLVSARRYFHAHPELGSCEYETAAYIRAALDKWQIPYETNGVSSTIATIKGDGADVGRTVAIRGDIDALPVKEATGLPFASCNDGVMHACGHDCHAAYMLGAAKILNELRPALNGTVKIIFQEGEEIGVGARSIMGASLLDDVDVIAGLHVSQEYDLGKFIVGYGVMSSYGANGEIEITAAGGGEDSGNVILAASEIISALTGRSSVVFPANQQIVLVPTVIRTESGEGAVPVKVRLFYNFRTLHPENLQVVKELLTGVPKEVAKLWGTEARVNVTLHDTVVNNNKAATDLAVGVIKDAFGEEAVVWGRPFMGGEDFSVYQKKIPGVFLHLGGAVGGIYRALHTDKTYVDDQVLAIGEEFLLRYIFAYLNEGVQG